MSEISRGSRVLETSKKLEDFGKEKVQSIYNKCVLKPSPEKVFNDFKVSQYKSQLLLGLISEKRIKEACIEGGMIYLPPHLRRPKINFSLH